MSDYTKIENLKLTKEYKKRLKKVQRKLLRRCRFTKNSDKKLSDSKKLSKAKEKSSKTTQ